MALFISLIASLIALTVFVFELHGRQVHTLPLAARAGIGLAFLVIAIVSGKAWYETVQHPNSGATSIQEPATASRQSLGAIGTGSEVTAAPAVSNVEETTSPSVAPQEPPLRNVPRKTRPDEITVSEAGSSISDAAGAANDALSILRSPSYTVRGRLRSTQSRPDAGLQGLITTDLTLDVTLIGAEGATRDSFTVTSRGGGFTSDASALQARQRLREALEERRPKEH